MASASRIGQIITLRLSERLYTSAVLLPKAANTRNKQDWLLFFLICIRYLWTKYHFLPNRFPFLEWEEPFPNPRR